MSAKIHHPVIRFLVSAVLAANLLPIVPTVSAAPPQSTDALRLRMLSVTDPQVGGDEAFRMLVPAHWRVEGGIVWRHELANLAYVAMRVSDPSGPALLEVYPNIVFTWSQSGIFGFPQGSLYLGMYVQPPPPDATSFVQYMLLPQFRAHPDLRMVGRENLPEVARVVAANVQEPGAEKQVLAERLRIEYTEGGQAIEEDFYCVLVYARTPMMPDSTLWTTDRVFSFRAAKGRLDGMAPLLHSMLASVRVNPVWYGKYLQVVEMWRQNQMQAIRSAGELSRYIAQTNDEISAMNRQAWEAQQASQDRMSRQFSEYIRGVETYQDPVAGRAVELPSGYREAWVSGNGEYLLSNQAGFNPNIGATQNWQRMKTAP